ncbi:MAG: hypothetical protein KF805_04575 [Phycisphaeraceae bacterium]|nr:hypothetical protein [Phycisphaeraceae bacterium]
MKIMAFGALALAAIAGAANASIVEANLSDGLMTSAAGLLRVGAFADRNITPGDTYNAALLGQSPAGAAFVTNAAGRVTTFTFGNNNAHGTLVGSGATVNMQSIDLGDIAVGVRRIVVACYTTNSSNLWLSGITIGGQAMNQGRFDVGTAAIGGNGLLWDGIPGVATGVSIFSALWSPSNGFAAPVATSGALTNAQVLPNMGSAVVWNGVVGNTSIISEVDIIFDITYQVPAPGVTSVLAFAGLVAARRRRA